MRQTSPSGHGVMVPLAPLLPSSWAPSSTVQGSAPAIAASAAFPAECLRERDVLLRKGGRPTHGKVPYFQYLQAHAKTYAAFKSPIDRRLMARELVDAWLANGGRFCTAAISTKPAGSKDLFRVASTEEALQFTRRVLVRHFTSGLGTSSKPSKKEPSRKCVPSVVVIPEVTSVNDDDSLTQTEVTDDDSSPPSCHSSSLCKDLERATSEAADALCYLRFVRTESRRGLDDVHLPPVSTTIATAARQPDETSQHHHHHCVSPTSDLSLEG